MTTVLERGPLHERLRLQLQQQIAAGRWHPGDRIPSERELARTYGVSQITVRRALHDLALEGVVVRRVPNGTFVTAAGARPRHLGIATFGVDAAHSHFFGPLVLAIQQGAPDLARLQLFAAPEGAPRARWLRQLAEERGVDGIIVATPSPLAYDDVAPLDLRGLPYVLLNRRIPGHAVWCAGTDDYAVGRQAVDYLYTLGHRRLAHVAGPAQVVTAADKLHGFLDGLAAHGLLSPGINGAAAPVEHGRYSYGPAIDDESGYDAMRPLLARDPRPTAVFAAGDTLAVGVYRALKDEGLRIPDDVSVIGMSNEPYVKLLEPPLTTLEYPLADLGRAAVQLLLDQIEHRVGPGNGTDPTHRRRLVPVTLVERGSCRRLPAPPTGRAGPSSTSPGAGS